jgi:carboxypeptidase C (cathepsin A)
MKDLARVRHLNILLFAGAISAVTALDIAGRADDGNRAPRVAVTQHVVHIGREVISYTTTVAEDIIKDEKGQPGAAVITIAYTRNGVEDPVRRPVLFAFNGGPGASSSPLHMSGLGPVVREKPKDRNYNQLIENATSPLDVTDLVFIDPVSTGFSRALPGVDPKQWYSGKSDAIEVATVIQDWLKLHGREKSPLFLCGESYGTMRAGLIVKYVPKLRFRGALLVSGGGDSTEANAETIRRVGTMAAGAWYHRKVDRRGLTVQEFYAEAMRFARGEYAKGLAAGPSLSAADRHNLAEKLSSYIGLPPELIEAKELKVDTKTYMFNLLKADGLRTGALDTRVTSELKPNAAGEIDDPALGVVTPTTGGAVPTPESIGAVVSPAVGRYISEDLKFPSSDPYYGVNFIANTQWTFSKEDREESTATIMASAMKVDPKLRLFAIAGIYDLVSGSDGAGFRQSGVPADRLTIDTLPGPHEVYEGAVNRAGFDNDVRKFIDDAK